jgi:hypothetical protein
MPKRSCPPTLISPATRRSLLGPVKRPPFADSATAKQKLVEQRPPGIIERDKLAIEHVAPQQEMKHFLEPLHPVAIAQERPAASGVSRSLKATKLGLKHSIRMVERLSAR